MSLKPILYEYRNEYDDEMIVSEFRVIVEQRYIEIEGEANETINDVTNKIVNTDKITYIR